MWVQSLVGRFPGEGNGNPLQYHCWENPKNRGIWQTKVHWGCKELDMTEGTQRVYKF